MDVECAAYGYDLGVGYGNVIYRIDLGGHVDECPVLPCCNPQVSTVGRILASGGDPGCFDTRWWGFEATSALPAWPCLPMASDGVLPLLP